MIIPWYVLTGAPSSGKTTLVNLLEKEGYDIIPEPAKELIDENFEKGTTLEELRKVETDFTDMVVERQLSNEAAASKDKLIVLDRGLPDYIAYYQYFGDGPSSEFVSLCKNRYKLIFYLEPARFEKTYYRNENDKMAREIGELTYQAYVGLNYKVIKVPPIDKQQRLELIKKYIKK